MYQQRYWHQNQFDTVERLQGIAKEAGVSLATLAVSWVMANPAITAPIIGASRPDQLADSLAAAEDGPMAQDLKDTLDDLTKPWRAVDSER
jgi:aryl-alcohol dehydrogenase (NADP+)